MRRRWCHIRNFRFDIERMEEVDVKCEQPEKKVHIREICSGGVKGYIRRESCFKSKRLKAEKENGKIMIKLREKQYKMMRKIPRITLLSPVKISSSR